MHSITIQLLNSTIYNILAPLNIVSPNLLKSDTMCIVVA